MPKLENIRRSFSGHFAPPIARVLAKTRITPNGLTWTGFVINIGAAALIVTNHLVAAGIVMLVAGLFDMLDGALARVTGKETRFGAVLDSTLDRVCEAMLLLAVAYVFARDGEAMWSLVTGMALVASLLISYIRARIEGLGMECKAGIFTRPERVIILALGLLLSGITNALIIAISLLAILSLFTVIERLVFASRRLKD